MKEIDYRNTVRYKYYHQNKPFKQVTEVTDVDSFSKLYYSVMQSFVEGYDIPDANAMQGAEDICVIILKQFIKPKPSDLLNHMYNTIAYLDEYLPTVKSLIEMNNIKIDFTENEDVYMKFLELQASEIE